MNDELIAKYIVCRKRIKFVFTIGGLYIYIVFVINSFIYNQQLGRFNEKFIGFWCIPGFLYVQNLHQHSCHRTRDILMVNKYSFTMVSGYRNRRRKHSMFRFQWRHHLCRLWAGWHISFYRRWIKLAANKHEYRLLG